MDETVKHGVTAIIYDDMGTKYFLILHRSEGWEGWEFVKGSIEEGEEPEQAAAREVFEETGIKRFSIKAKLDSPKEYTNENGEKCVHDVFLVEASMNVPVHISKAEHDTYQWSKKELILERLTHANDKIAFQQALSKLKA